MKLIHRYWWQLSLLILISITVLSLSPLDELPKIAGSDKLHHFLAHFALMLPVALRRPRYWLWLGVAFAFYSGGIELLQPYVNRYAEWQDWFANISGIVVAVTLGAWRHRRT